VIFVTAFDDYALQAFDAAAVDYLLKPVDPARLARAVERLRQNRRGRPPRPAPTRLIVGERGRVQVIALADVTWLQAADNYVDVHAAGRVRLLRRTLENLLADLGPAFVRIHRSRAVALAAVTGITPKDKGDATVQLAGGESLPCSRAHRSALVAALGSRSPR
jgi:two-component system LytT family response regulator